MPVSDGSSDAPTYECPKPHRKNNKQRRQIPDPTNITGVPFIYAKSTEYFCFEVTAGVL